MRTWFTTIKMQKSIIQRRFIRILQTVYEIYCYISAYIKSIDSHSGCMYRILVHFRESSKQYELHLKYMADTLS